ncbi:hypothetical protein RBB50_008646 [Rhinocladiella similis]
MTLKDTYQRFLDLPNPISLSENASLHYIPTLTTFSQPAQIIRHLETQNKKLVSTKHAKLISIVEGANSLALEVETVLEFISGGGSYLPGLENFVVDKIAVIPVTHFVLFDAERKITQVRLSWDQASLLKQTDVIGSRGKNWPVTDGKDQVRLITASFNAAPKVASELPTSPRGRSENQSLASSRNVSPGKKHLKDPHASLDLFSPKPVDEPESIASPNAVAPRASARPPPREMSELFAAGHEDHEPGSPKKPPVQVVVAPRGGASQKFAPPRLFADDPNEAGAIGYKSDPSKYNHFDLGEAIENDPMQYHGPNRNRNAPLRPKTDKHGSQWDFDDFYTPAKVPQKVRDQDVVHFSLNNKSSEFATPATQKIVNKPRRDNEAHFEFQDDGPPVERHVVPKPRKDAETHFEFRDTATPVPNRASGRPASSGRQGLYSNHIFEEEDSGRPQEKAPLSTITTNTNRKNDFDSHWSMSDVSPANEKTNNENTRAAGHRKKPSQMDSHWSIGDDNSQAAPAKAQNKGPKSFWDF